MPDLSRQSYLFTIFPRMPQGVFVCTLPQGVDKNCQSHLRELLGQRCLWPEWLTDSRVEQVSPLAKGPHLGRWVPLQKDRPISPTASRAAY